MLKHGLHQWRTLGVSLPGTEHGQLHGARAHHQWWEADELQCKVRGVQPRHLLGYGPQTASARGLSSLRPGAHSGRHERFRCRWVPHLLHERLRDPLGRGHGSCAAGGRGLRVLLGRCLQGGAGECHRAPGGHPALRGGCPHARLVALRRWLCLHGLHGERDRGRTQGHSHLFGPPGERHGVALGVVAISRGGSRRRDPACPTSEGRFRRPQRLRPWARRRQRWLHGPRAHVPFAALMPLALSLLPASTGA
mmetsp:Transcript_58529/g.125776  ORF Transcript_58529/g.125776 Transcript_58529/m.125776 type:complete len:251 (+) Transcript_58529:2751-3503(+)